MSKYIEVAESNEEAVNKFVKSTYDIADIACALVDRKHYEQGTTFLSIVLNSNFIKMMEYFTCDFKAIKEELGIQGAYIDRNAKLDDKENKPQRNGLALVLDNEEMGVRAKKVIKNLIADFEEITAEANEHPEV